MIVMTATCAVLAGTFLAAVLLFGRFVLLALGFFLAGSAFIALQAQFFNGWQSIALLAMALVLIALGWPAFTRRKRVQP